MMEKIQGQPWSFTIEFDPEKAARHGYKLDTLYDYVGKNVEKLGNERIGLGTWKAKEGVDEVIAQCTALSLLARARWVMENVKSWVAFEDDAPEGHDHLEMLRRVSPHLIVE